MFLLQICAEHDTFLEEREKLARAPAARGERGAKASADGGKARKPGSKSVSQAAIGGGPVTIQGGAGHDIF